MHKKRFMACALSAILTLSPMGGLAVHAADGQDAPLILYSSFNNESAVDESGAGNNGTIVRDEQFGTVEFVDGVNGGKAIRIVNDSNHRKKIRQQIMWILETI